MSVQKIYIPKDFNLTESDFDVQIIKITPAEGSGNMFGVQVIRAKINGHAIEWNQFGGILPFLHKDLVIGTIQYYINSTAFIRAQKLKKIESI